MMPRSWRHSRARETQLGRHVVAAPTRVRSGPITAQSSKEDSVKAFARNVFAAHSVRILSLALALAALPVHAQPLKIVDETYTATAQNTQKSHYRINVIAGTPTNWRTPVDYGNGSVSIRYEVLEKPSAANTIFNICFEGSTKICSPYPPVYSAPGVYNFSWQLSEFWQYAMIDWTQGIKDIAVVLKTEAEVEAQ